VTALGVSWIELIGRYSVKRLLGSGAFASVWLAHDDLLDVPVAVKVLADNWSVHTDVRARFLTEAKLLRQADSDRVLRVLDIGELPDGRPYFVTSYADGGSLADRLDDAELPLNEALDVLIQVCESVCVLHEMGVVHRDLKPSNVLFKTDNAGRRRLLLADLGIAKALAPGLRLDGHGRLARVHGPGAGPSGRHRLRADRRLRPRRDRIPAAVRAHLDHRAGAGLARAGRAGHPAGVGARPGAALAHRAVAGRRAHRLRAGRAPNAGRGDVEHDRHAGRDACRRGRRPGSHGAAHPAVAGAQAAGGRCRAAS